MTFSPKKLLDIFFRILFGIRHKRSTVIRLGSRVLKIPWSKENRKALIRECITSNLAKNSNIYSCYAVSCKVSYLGAYSQFISEKEVTDTQKILLMLNMIEDIQQFIPKFIKVNKRDVISNYASHLGLSGDYRGVDDDLITLVPQSMMHGDFLPKNLIVSNNRSVYLIDWEYGFNRGSFLYDIWKLGSCIKKVELVESRKKEALVTRHEVLTKDILEQLDLDKEEYQEFCYQMDRIVVAAWRAEKNIVY